MGTESLPSELTAALATCPDLPCGPVPEPWALALVRAPAGTLALLTLLMRLRFEKLIFPMI